MDGGISSNISGLLIRKGSLERRQGHEHDNRRTYRVFDKSDTFHMCRYAEIIREETPRLQDGVAFQSIAVASLQTLKKVLVHQRRAADAAISLAQGEKLSQMIDDSQATVEAIAGILNAQGSCILNLASEEPNQTAADNSWWFALAEALHTIEDGTHRIVSLASGQPKGGPARRLSSIVVRMLRTQHHTLMSEAEEWIS